jgi:hypothetical protein
VKGLVSRMDPRQQLGRRVAIGAATLLASLAALFPVGASAQTSPVGMSVSASVTGCRGGAAAGGITCEIYVSFSSVAGATSYTAEVISPGGGAQQFSVGSGSATLPVAYSGNGEYVVTVKAWGDPVGSAKKGVVAKDSSG